MIPKYRTLNDFGQKESDPIHNHDHEKCCHAFSLHGPDRRRFDKAQGIAHSRQIVTIDKDPEQWLVESETVDGKFYKTGFDGCDCMDFQTRGDICKHMWALIRRGIA